MSRQHRPGAGGALSTNRRFSTCGAVSGEVLVDTVDNPSRETMTVNPSPA